MSRKAVFVTETKDKINKLKMTPERKIKSLEVTNSILKKATLAVGAITIIDLIVPDPVLGLDEAALTLLTSLLGYGTKLVDNKIEALSKGEDASLKAEEVTNLATQIFKLRDAKKAKEETVEQTHTL